MPEVSKSSHPDDVDVSISEVIDGIYRISGFVERYGITFNQFLIQGENPTLIHTGPIGMYSKIEEKVKEIINLEKLTLHFYILKVMNGVAWSFSNHQRQSWYAVI
jgi:hypothetical protein